MRFGRAQSRSRARLSYRLDEPTRLYLSMVASLAEPASVSPGAVMVTSGNLAAIVKQGLGLRPNPLLRAVAKHDGDSRLYRRLPVLCPEWRLGYSLDAGHIQHTRARESLPSFRRVGPRRS